MIHMMRWCDEEIGEHEELERSRHTDFDGCRRLAAVLVAEIPQKTLSSYGRFSLESITSSTISMRRYPDAYLAAASTLTPRLLLQFEASDPISAFYSKSYSITFLPRPIHTPIRGLPKQSLLLRANLRSDPLSNPQPSIPYHPSTRSLYFNSIHHSSTKSKLLKATQSLPSQMLKARHHGYSKTAQV